MKHLLLLVVSIKKAPGVTHGLNKWSTSSHSWCQSIKHIVSPNLSDRTSGLIQAIIIRTHGLTLVAYLVALIILWSAFLSIYIYIIFYWCCLFCPDSHVYYYRDAIYISTRFYKECWCFDNAKTFLIHLCLSWIKISFKLSQSYDFMFP